MIDFTEKNEFHTMDFDDLKHTCLDCQKCSLSETRQNVVFGTGPVPCDLMAIGEGPGEQEDNSGIPFVGRAGQLLTKIIESVGLNREVDCYITNIVKCRPPGNRNPELKEVEACQGYLIRQIQIVQPKVLLLIGSPCLKSILGPSYTITQSRGQWFTTSVDYMDQPLFIMPLFHPSYLLRNASKEKGKPKWLTWQDMKEVKSALQLQQNDSSA